MEFRFFRAMNILTWLLCALIGCGFVAVLALPDCEISHDLIVIDRTVPRFDEVQVLSSGTQVRLAHKESQVWTAILPPGSGFSLRITGEKGGSRSSLGECNVSVRSGDVILVQLLEKSIGCAVGRD
jgi:hypothetical protein